MLEQLRPVVALLLSVAAWAFGLSTVWNKLLARVNGLGGRVKKTEDAGAEIRGRHEELREHVAQLELKHASELAELREAQAEREAALRERMRAAETALEILREERNRGERS